MTWDVVMMEHPFVCNVKAVLPVIASNEVPLLQIKSVGSHSTSGREKEGNKEKTRWGEGRHYDKYYKNNLISLLYTIKSCYIFLKLFLNVYLKSSKT